jgi:hypothetical protein
LLRVNVEAECHGRLRLRLRLRLTVTVTKPHSIRPGTVGQLVAGFDGRRLGLL